MADNNKLLYFAYGSNLDAKRLQSRCPSAEPYCDGTLFGWRVVERLYADIEMADPEEDKTAAVHGMLWSIDADDLDALDFYEGYPHLYTRITVMVEVGEGGWEPALVYVMTRETAEERDGVPYPETYRRLCEKAFDALTLIGENPFRKKPEEK